MYAMKIKVPLFTLCHIVLYCK
uniref:Uncharacterized protein n=1 Tax=Anguilla anguilla TaxID=7936 RepID=A0A0E9R193_ANGAN